MNTDDLDDYEGSALSCPTCFGMLTQDHKCQWKWRHYLGNGYTVTERAEPDPAGLRHFYLFYQGRAIGGFNDSMWSVTGERETLDVNPSLLTHRTYRDEGHHGHIRNGRWVPA